MKLNKYLLILLISFISLSTLAQTSKKTLNYQAVILDPKAIDIPGASITGQPLNKGNVCLRFSLINAQGGLDYEETQQVTTDEYGLVNVAIGTGTQANTNNSTSLYKGFDAIQWNANVKSLKVSVSYDGCNSFKQVSTQALSYTPYTLYADAVDYKNVREAPTKLSQFSNDAGYLIPKDLDPLKADVKNNTADIKSNTSQIAMANQTIAENKKSSEAVFLIANQNITSLQTKVAENTTAINQNTSSIGSITTKLTDQQNQIFDNRNQISATNNNLTTQIGGLQGQLTVTNSTVSNLSGATEVVSNKSTSTDLGAASPSDQLYPSQKAAKTYIDQSISRVANSGVPDATTLAAGKLQLSGDLGGTATSPTVPALASKENTVNKSTSVQTDGGSNTKYPSVKAVKDYVDQATMGTALQATVDAKADKNSPTFTGTPVLPTGTIAITQTSTDNSTKLATTAFVQQATAGIALQAAVDAKADKNSPTFTGTPVLPTGTTAITQTSGDNTTKLATTAFVQLATAAGIIDASSTTKGKLKLAGDLGGTADSPSVNNAAVIAKVLTGFTSGAGAITASDNILQAIQKLSGNSSTNANLTGAITSSGNVTSVASQTGTGSTFVMDTAPTLVTPVLGVATATTVNKLTLTAPATGATLSLADGSSLVTAGAFVQTLTATAATNITLPTTGTLATLAGAETLSNKTFIALALGAATGTSLSVTGSLTSTVATGTAPFVVSSTTPVANLNIGGNATNVTGTVAVANGGTGSTTKNFVDLTTNQAIAGVKIFNSDITVNGVKIGLGAGNNDQNVAIGADALASGTGARNTAVGYGAMRQYSGTSFDNNTSVGYMNLPTLTSGSGNTSVGAESMMALSTGTENTSVGNQSLINTTGNSNVGIGKRAGQTISTGSQNTIIGTNSDVATNNLSNATAIGYGSIVAASNTIQLGNTSVTAVNTSGTVTAPTFVGALTGNASTATNVSGTVGVANGGTGATTATAAFNALSPMTTAGDLVYGGTSGAGTRLAKGTNGQVLTLASGLPSWASPSAGGSVGGFTHYLGEALNGGIIYYLYKGSDGLEHGLIVTLTESTAEWQSAATLTNANRTEDGAFNTNLMTGSPAATYVTGLGTGWYLPSIDELGLLYYNRFTVQKALRAGSNTLLSNTVNYWGSTEYNASSSYSFNFNFGFTLNDVKTLSRTVRGVRAF